jgi:signal transduction histidine kinase
VTERRRAVEELRELTAQMLAMQDQERRRIARELHDSTAQNLLGAALDIDRVLRLVPEIDARAESALQEGRQLIEQSQREIRTVAYLLHPPMLDDAGLPSALSWYVNGFSKRSGIAVSLEVSSEMTERRLPTEVEMALFRVVQEGLTNVHRHSGSNIARVRLAVERAPSAGESVVTLEITDAGRGMPSEAVHAAVAGGDTGSVSAPALGVGLVGMRERVRQLGGRLDIRSGAQGTSLQAIVPLGENAESAIKQQSQCAN